MSGGTDNEYEGIPLVTGPSADRLNERQLLDYRTQRENCISWLLAMGKDPKSADGYAKGTVDPRSRRMDIFYRWVWDNEGGYTTSVTGEHGDAYLRELARQDKSLAHKANCQKAVQMLLKWRSHQHGVAEWEPEIKFSGTQGTTQPRDYLTRDERATIREAALEYGTIPSYGDVSPEERDRWKAYLAQRFEKPKSDVTPEDWDRANGWKIPSLVWASLDAGLRPVEVKRAVSSWVDTDNGVLRIPKEESSKNIGNWIVSLQSRTADVLERWLNEREAYELYDDTEKLWLTREGNPYGSRSLGYLLENLCDIGDISTESRKMSWYSIRHSTGTYLTREEDLAASQAQLRHQSPTTTMKYDQTPPEDRRDALNRIE